jgi:hypothetical protein
VSKWSSLLLLAPLLCWLLPGGASADPIKLKGERWQISINPQTLAVRGSSQKEPDLLLSSAQSAPLDISNLRKDDRSAEWDIPATHLHVAMRLDEKDVLRISFAASSPGTITWPILGGDSARRGLILPLFEGLYVPATDPEWAEFLINEGPRDTAGGLSMPFWAADCGAESAVYILNNPFNNKLEFAKEGGAIGLRLTHQFAPNSPTTPYGLSIRLGDSSPVGTAKCYREELIAQGQFVTLKQKIERTLDAAKLLGAAHVYLWGDGLIGRADLTNAAKLAQRILAKEGRNTAGGRIYKLLDPDGQKLLADLAAKPHSDNYDKGRFAAVLDAILRRRDFYDESLERISKDQEASRLIVRGVNSLTEAEVGRLNCLLLREEFGDLLPTVESWGEGWSVKMMQSLADGGLDRLWLGSPSWDGLRLHPDAVRKAIDLGYLVGPYDSFHSIHSPTDADTWETAQFDQKLYDTGAVVLADGKRKKGFRQKGYILSDVASAHAVHARVSDLMRQFNCNSWFIDCDADGELYDDYSPLHPATQADQMNARLARLAWIRDTIHTVIGSEGGAAYAAGTIHFAHGMMTPVIGWGDPDLTNRASPFFLGGYYPPDGPAVFFKQVPMKPAYQRIYANPRFRLPLYETVFHDSVIATHQWGYGSLKFADPDHVRELLELLYDVPPLYHLNPAEWAKRKDLIQSHYRFFSPLHRDAGLLAMSDFQWLTEDRLVQRTTFGDWLEMVANFSAAAFAYQGNSIPPGSILARQIKTGAQHMYSPGSAGRAVEH